MEFENVSRKTRSNASHDGGDVGYPVSIGGVGAIDVQEREEFRKGCGSIEHGVEERRNLQNDQKFSVPWKKGRRENALRRTVTVACSLTLATESLKAFASTESTCSSPSFCMK